MISTNFIAEQQQELDYKITEVQMLKDQLTLMDVRIDRYDTIIGNIDKQIIPLIDEILIILHQLIFLFFDAFLISFKLSLMYFISSIP